MRILAVATLVSPDGEYGGPIRVAVNQCRELAARGHDVTLAAAARGFDTLPTTVEGVPARLFPARTALPGTGFAGLSSPGLGRWLRRNLSTYDIVHVHLARDLVTLPAARLARRAGVPYVTQTHGMVDPSRNPLARPLDAMLTRPVLHGAAAVLHLTGTERRGLVAVAGPELPFHELPNGVPVPDEPATGTGREVLYLARLAPRKRPMVMLQVADRLHRDFPDVEVAVVGPDEGERAGLDAAAAELHDRGVPISVSGPLPPEQTLARMRRAGVYVLPSVDEPFPMSVLEAMSLGLPVVVTDSCGLAGFVAEVDAGLVVGPDPAETVEAVRTLVADPAHAARLGANARRGIIERYGIAAVVDRLLEVYLSGDRSRG
ncbi:glycosyltransferase [Microlunatus sp. Y2014]|uniref:glycosyltransferase n=1 Tax=Microlunatus sp. Y2014 TaxID=3418488 RepID=UPI003DA74DDC